MKAVASTTLEDPDYDAIDSFATRNGISFSAAMRIVVKRGLPTIESEVLGDQFAGRPVPKRQPALAAEGAK
jgi:hypothetical protein